MEIQLQFFFYGTLMEGSGNAAAQAAHDRLRPLGPASIKGALWAISDVAGWYPALVPAANGLVHGVLYAADAGFAPDDLARLDAWEDYRPDQLANSLYQRVGMPVTDAFGRSVAAQVYCYNQPLPAGALAIGGGDFHAWLAATGCAAYSG